MITQDKWTWQAYPGHFCGADKCRFRLNTVVGKYLISTVGEWFPTEGKGIHSLAGVAGLDPEMYYETMVFKHKKHDCQKNHCVVRVACGDVLEVSHADNPQKAHDTHMGTCLRWAEKQNRKKREPKA